MTDLRIGLVGAGNIAETHSAAIRSIRGLTLVAVADPVPDRAAAFARRWGISQVHGSAEAMLAAKGIDAVHILVPPPLHSPIGELILRAGLDVFLEKPMAQSSEECAALQRAAKATGAALKVNHNFVYHPAHLRAKRMIAANRIGRVRHVECQFNLPLRQLGNRQLSHWMFDCPRNLLLEQAVHPLSQIDDLLGPAHDIEPMAAPPLMLGEAQEIYRTWLVSMRCERGNAQLQISLGETFPAWNIKITGDDGALQIDYLVNTVLCETSGRYPDFFDYPRRKLAVGIALQRQAAGNFLAYCASTVKLRGRSDVFFHSMRESIDAFYRARSIAKSRLDGAEGARMVELCERIVSAARLPAPVPRASTSIAAASARHDVLLIGGTGFVGSHLVPQLLNSGRRIGVLARGTNNLPALFSDPRITMVRGDVRSREDVMHAIGDAPLVVNLAHGGGGGSRAEVEKSLVGSAVIVANACLEKRVRRLVYISSIASLYLGDPSEVITGATAPDPLNDERADYARAKAIAEREMLHLYKTKGLPVCILRPGVVIGAGGIAFHSGIGFFNHENHCMGWNRGRNPLPLVLAEDVADVIVRALEVPEVEGRSYNIVGDVRLTARDYVRELARATGRPLQYHPQSVLKLYGIEIFKACIKRAAGRRDPWPSLRDLKSRGLAARFDCSDVQRHLEWRPMQDRAAFVARAFDVHGPAA